jgi:polyisoprenoid-binding protein YceI
MKFFCIKLFLASLLPFFLLSDANWKVKSSAVTFKVKNAGITVDGTFSGLEAEIRFNPLKPEEAHIKASVSSATINTGTAMRDNHLRKPEYFDAEKYPKITLQSVKVEKTGPVTFNGTFKLSMKGISREVIIPFTFMKLPEKTEFKGTFSINRRDYGIGGSSISMADNVNITILLNVTD